MTALGDDERAAWYDVENVWGPDDDFFLALANERPERRVLDLGCGTGRLTLALARAGHLVTGVDPDRAALALARTKPGADDVIWVEGTSSALDDAEFDVALMTGHVVQAITDPRDWAETLTDLRRVLAPGGVLAFDTRDPAARAWERWTPAGSREAVTLADGTQAVGWYDVTHVGSDGVVTFDDHRVLADGSETVDEWRLAFRDEGRLRADLAGAGFAEVTVAGGWRREPVGEGLGELVVVAWR
ncbi:class I SAM-dependent methyltransferase [Xylanimonas ulmi]|uniref:Methyltransferase family protein n=1 Tax=Xylanimonas ulmi TaxID=228973 RepID=A0A4Q7M565_9MICO|nr:class I SAM-dependent methyltransferase [Xylanibacterium ulmi]RZS61782.1 methyltransferase family protein [Xylanibacterium ulmi]